MLILDWPFWFAATVMGWCCLTGFALVQLFAWRGGRLPAKAVLRQMTYTQVRHTLDRVLYWGEWRMFSYAFLLVGGGLLLVSAEAVVLVLR